MDRKKVFYGRASLWEVHILFIYFSIVYIIGLTLSIYIIIINNTGNSSFKFFYNKDTLNQYNLALIGSIGTTILGCSIYYIKKLYKLSLGSNFLITISTPKEKLENMGTMFYFMFRPLFSISFTILMILGIKCGMITVAGKSFTVNSSFTDFTMFLSYFIGFSSGRFLTSIEKKSEKIINNVLNEGSISR